ncbi:MAG: DUF3822 family protein [Flavobacteriaceae bacterium]|nr:DUF3822 family protein [Flavobacteriaceae bacterium]
MTTKSHKISVHCFSDGFSVYNKNEVIISSENDYSKLPLFIQELNSKHQSSELNIVGMNFESPSVFVPKDYFKKEVAASYIENFCVRPKSYSVSHQLVDSQPLLVNVFYSNKWFSEIKEKNGLKLTYKHYWSCILSYLLGTQQKFKKNQKIVLYFNENYFDIFHLEEKQLKGANRFDFENENEIIYFLLCYLEAHKLKASNIDFIPFGKFDSYIPYYQKLSEFFRLKYFNDLNQSKDNSHYPWKLFT